MPHTLIVHFDRLPDLRLVRLASRVVNAKRGEFELLSVFAPGKIDAAPTYSVM